ncbi:glycosyltransferase [Primorskyibacter sp. S187A]|uniref:glycosyltransferase n=1 Tax=Primorskyibacter sp. S187A TaxID=3415130 RepID=UPI003C7E7399
MSSKLLVVLLNYRTADMTARAADAAVLAMDGLPAEMVIVDNDSQDGSFEALCDHVAQRGWPHVRVLASGWNGGYGAGNNYGMRAGLADGSAPDVYYLLNSDAFPDKDAIRVLYDTLQATPEAGFAGSQIYGSDGATALTAFRFPSWQGDLEAMARSGPVSKLLRAYRVPRDDLTTGVETVDWISGASLMMRRETLEEIGLFDETFFLYFEETDLCRRAAQAGWQTIYVPDSRVQHIGGASTGMNSWKRVPKFWLDSRTHYFIKNHGRAYAALATLAHLTGGLLWHLRRVFQGKPQLDPDRYYRDLIAHDLRVLMPLRDAPKPQVRVLAPLGRDA